MIYWFTCLLNTSVKQRILRLNRGRQTLSNHEMKVTKGFSMRFGPIFVYAYLYIDSSMYTIFLDEMCLNLYWILRLVLRIYVAQRVASTGGVASPELKEVTSRSFWLVLPPMAGFVGII
ncbi:hypothetical protein TorRG33x02_019270 [Trema orientale]|uniref:Uncharacterized protein n=1 Tax=Trema orientale TaxID=63057 RepID=A0A2P5FWG8_TREOI|nr:hypothetical protein TorRG33x02_019270 [Trema orientale]